MFANAFGLLAGMPTITLTDVARLRLDAISFFLFLIVIATLVVRCCWNSLRTDFSKLPHLTVGKSFGLVTLWGLVFLLALTMISGARELMTPGAWEKQGLTHKLRAVTPEHELKTQDRRDRLSLLYQLLVSYARDHEGKFPDTLADAVADGALRHPPRWPNASYQYQSGHAAENLGVKLVSEPNVYQGQRFAVLVGGVIVEEPWE